jgi:menaquinol-cytochrome c reductase iron-sulfur subunit
MKTPSNPCCRQSESSPNQDSRRCFLGKTAAIIGGAAALAVPAVTGVVAFLNPLRQKSQGGDFMRLASLDAIPEDGSPLKVSVIADRTDAWTRFPKEAIGAVFLSRAVGQAKEKVTALQVICPHAGCSITFDASAGKYFCPCHAASFDLAGVRTDATSPSPRNMDTLEVEIRNKNEVWVKFETFQVGTERKVAQS